MGELAEEIAEEIAEPLALLRRAWLQGQLPAGEQSLGPLVEEMHVDGRSYRLDAPTAMRMWERGAQRLSHPDQTLAPSHPLAPARSP